PGPRQRPAVPHPLLRVARLMLRPPTPPPRPDARRQRGFVLVTVSVMGALLMALWLIAWQATHDGLRAERFDLARERRDVALVRALAAGLHLLETGEPPSDPYACLYTVVDGADTHEVTLTYE